MRRKTRMSDSEDQDTEKKPNEGKRLPVITGDFDFRPSYVLGKEGPIAKSVPDYQVRQSQITLAENIQQAFNDEKHLVAEAATGTGKSYANLLAAFEKSIGTQTPVVISTHTIALQEQLLEKDVPFLLEKLGLKDRVEVALAKGRGNYVSIRRAHIAFKEKQKGYTKLQEWLTTTTDGTKSSLPFNPDPLLWSRAKSDTDQCLGEACDHFEDCFYQKSRKKLSEAFVIITNHSLVLLDRKMKASGLKGVLPEYNYLILDEGHELETVARQVLTFELKQKDIPAVLYELWNDDRASGFLNALYDPAKKTLLEASAGTELKDGQATAVKEAVEAIQNVLEQNKEFFKEVETYTGSETVKRFTEKNVLKTDLIKSVEAVNASLKILLNHIEDKNHKAAVDFAMKRCTEIAMGVDDLLNLPNLEGKDYPNVVAWASSQLLPSKNRTYSVTVAPIFLKPELQRILFKPLKSVVLTSATLATGGQNPFRMVESILGLVEPMRLRLPPVFDYKKQAFIVVVEDMPEQGQAGYIQDLATQVKKYAKVGSGGTFVLFTSFKVMNEVFDLVKDNLEVAGYRLFCQGKDLTRNQMISEFKKTTKGILFGVSSFWTGVDIPGKALQKLIIAKLPFPAPNDPLMQAQEEIYKRFDKNFFMERALPMTAIMLKQGFGRLIRKTTDKGMVVILDSRIATKKYGKMLLSSLPPECPVKYGRRDSKLN